MAEDLADVQLREYRETGDPRRFGDFVEATARPLARLLSRFSSDQNTLDELAQRSYIAALTRLDTYRGPRGLPWLLGIAWREGLSYRRELGRRHGKEALMSESDQLVVDGKPRASGEPADRIVRDEGIAALRSALGTLDFPERAAVELVWLEGLEYAETASVLGIPVGTVKSRVHRALGRLRTRLGAAHAAVLPLLGPGAADQLSCGTGSAVTASRWKASVLDAAGRELSGKAGASSPARAPASAVPMALSAAASLAVVICAVLWIASAATDDAALAPLGSPPLEPTLLLAPGERGERVKETAPPVVPVVPAAPVETGDVWVRGRVVDADGRPLPDVTIALEFAFDQVWLWRFMGQVGVGSGVADSSRPTVSGPDGRFAVAVEARGPWFRKESHWGEHFVLRAKRGDGQTRMLRLKADPDAPPDVVVSFAPFAAVRARVLAADGTPALEEPDVAAIRHAVAPHEYAYYRAAERASEPESEALEFVLADLAPGRWELAVEGLPHGTRVDSGRIGPIDLEPGETLEVDVLVEPRPGLFGTVVSPGGFGAFGATISAVDASGEPIAKTTLRATPRERDADTGDELPSRKGVRGPATALDVAAQPTPFELELPEGASPVTLVLADPEGRVLNRFGPFTGSRAGLELVAAAYEPMRGLRVSISGAAPLEPESLHVVLEREGEHVARRILPDRSGSPGGDFWGLAPGNYRVVAFAIGRHDGDDAILRGETEFVLRAVGPEVVKVDVALPAPALLELEGLAATKSDGSRDAWVLFEVRAQGDAPDRELARRLSMKAPSDGVGRLYLSSGDWTVRVAPPRSWSRGETSVGHVLEIALAPGVLEGLDLSEWPDAALRYDPVPDKDSVGADTDAGVERAMVLQPRLRLQGTTARGRHLSVAAGGRPGQAITFVDVPEGAYDLELIDGVSGETVRSWSVDLDGGDHVVR